MAKISLKRGAAIYVYFIKQETLLFIKSPYCLLYNRELFECPPVLSVPGNDPSKRLCQTQQVIIIDHFQYIRIYTWL